MFFVKVVLLFGSFTIFRYLGSVIEIELYTGLQGWALALFAAFAASIISGPIEVLIMKKRLKKLVNVV